MKAVASQEVRAFLTSAEAATHARHYSRYAHRVFIVWQAPDGRWMAGPENRATLRQVADEIGTGAAFCYREGGGDLKVRRDDVLRMLENLPGD